MIYERDCPAFCRNCFGVSAFLLPSRAIPGGKEFWRFPPVGPKDAVRRFADGFADAFPVGAGDLEERAPVAPGVLRAAIAKARTPPWANPRDKSSLSRAEDEESPSSVPEAARRRLSVGVQERMLGCPAFEPEGCEHKLMTACCSTKGNALVFPVTKPIRDAS